MLFQNLVYIGNYDTVYVCETWLKQLSLKQRNFETVFRRDRPGRVGSGVLVVVKSGIQATRFHDHLSSYTLFIDLQTLLCFPVIE